MSEALRNPTWALCDVRLGDSTHLRRIGLKGPRAAEWLRELGVLVPSLPNSWRSIDTIDLIARLGANEFFIEQAQPATLVDRLRKEFQTSLDGVYPVLREDRAFVLSGKDAASALAQVCNVDFGNASLLAERQLVMTMMIGVAVLVIPQEIVSDSGNVAPEATAGYRIWCDPSYGDYLQSSLQDVIRDLCA